MLSIALRDNLGERRAVRRLGIAERLLPTERRPNREDRFRPRVRGRRVTIFETEVARFRISTKRA